MASTKSDPKKESPEKEKNEDKESKIDINKYKDPTGVSIEKLEKSFWLFRHRKDFKNSLIVFLVLLCIITWGYALFGYGKYLIVGMEEDKKMLKELTGPLLIKHSQVLKFAPKELKLSELNVIRDNQKFDLAIKITNPNPHHGGIFNYCFEAGKEKIKCGKNFVLPRDSKYLLALSQKINQKGRTTFNINKTNWKKLDYHKMPSWKNFKNERIDFKIENVELTPANKSKLSEEINLSDLSFSVTNNSGFGYYEVPFNILLINYNKIVGLNRYSIYNFKSKEKKNIEISWPNLNFTSGNIKIIPDINILNPEIYMKPGGTGETEDIRNRKKKKQNIQDVIE